MKMSGQFRVYAEKTGPSEPFSNMLLDGFFTLLNSEINPLSNSALISVGSSDIAVLAADTGLKQPVASASSTVVSAQPATISGGTLTVEWEIKATFTYQQLLTTIKEVGVNFSGSPTGTHSRAVLAVPVTLGADDRLVVEYKLTLTAPTADVTSTLSIDVDGAPTNYGFTARFGALLPLQAYTNLNSPFTVSNVAPKVHSADAVQGVAGVAVTSTSNQTVTSYDETRSAASKTLTMSATSHGNVVGGIKAIEVLGAKYYFDTAIAKDATNALSIGFKREFTR